MGRPAGRMPSADAYAVPEHEGGTFALGVRAVRRYLMTPAARAMESGRQAQEAVAMEATVTDVMTTNVVAVRKGTPFTDMAATLRDCRVNAFPVLDEHACGIWPDV